MRGGPPRQGYTIIEVMIFLAVSGVMFLIAAAFVSGKQDQVQFRQSMNDINTQVQQVINNVINGYYPSGTSFTCSVSGTGSLSITSGGNTQGTNAGCVFLGQVIQFGAGSSGQNPNDYGIFTVAGSQYGVNPSGGPVTTDPPACFVAVFSFPPTCPTGADPTAVYPISPVNGINLTQTNVFQGGMTVTGMYDTQPSNKLRGVGFFSNFGQSGNNSAVTQSLQVVVYSGDVTDTSNNNQGSMASDINNTGSGMADKIETNPDVIVCFSSGAGRYGTLTIGDNNGSGSRLTTSIQISSSKLSGC